MARYSLFVLKSPLIPSKQTNKLSLLISSLYNPQQRIPDYNSKLLVRNVSVCPRECRLVKQKPKVVEKK